MPRPMYFLAIETTRRRLAEVSCSRPSRPIAHQHATPIARLERQVLLGRPAHLGQQLRVLAAEDPAAQRLVARFARPVVERAQGDVVVRLGVGAVDGPEREVSDVHEVRRAWAPRCTRSRLARARP